MADFYPCLICQSYSQANIYHYTLKQVLFEFAFAHLRYFLGGDRPSQTNVHKLSFLKISNIKN